MILDFLFIILDIYLPIRAMKEIRHYYGNFRVCYTSMLQKDMYATMFIGMIFISVIMLFVDVPHFINHLV